MARIVADDLWVCVDCTQLTANGELGQGDADADAAHGEAMARELGADAPWLVLDSCADHNGECACASEEFSSRRCDGCGSPLAGYRHRAVILR